MTAVGNTAANRRLTFGVARARRPGAPARARRARLRPHAGADQRRARRAARPRRRRRRARSSSPCSSPRALTATVTRYVALRTLGLRPPPARRVASRSRRLTWRAADVNHRHRRSARAVGRARVRAARAGSRARAGRACSALAAVLCLWDLTISGYSNEYYAAAAAPASESWKAWFFGALDPGSFITVDKPPLSLWLHGPVGARVRLLVLQHAAAAGAVHDRRRRRCCSRPSGGRSARAAGLLAAARARADADDGRDRRASTTPTRCSCCCSSPPRTCTVRAIESGRDEAPRAGPARSSASPS